MKKTIKVTIDSKKPVNTYFEGSYKVTVYPAAGKQKSYYKGARGQLRQARERVYGAAKPSMTDTREI